ncbi:MAG: hypothetical protein ACPG49_12640 [Chitinophagales bacterium]
MKESYKKTLLGSFVAFFIGTSCCWLSSLAVWFGGVALFGVIVSFIEDLQWILILLGILLGVVSIVLYLQKKAKEE